MIDIARETVISLVDVARRLDVDVRTVRNWTKRPDNPLYAEPFGGKWVTTLEELQRWGRAGKKRKTSAAVSVVTNNRQHHAAAKHLQEVHGI
jgi:hypothetical protein